MDNIKAIKLKNITFMFLSTALFKISKSITEGIKTRDEAVSNCKANPVKNETKINDFKSPLKNFTIK
jgi:hypothetical protein